MRNSNLSLKALLVLLETFERFMNRLADSGPVSRLVLCKVSCHALLFSACCVTYINSKPFQATLNSSQIGLLIGAALAFLVKSVSL